jgi:hypothetical protein
MRAKFSLALSLFAAAALGQPAAAPRPTLALAAAEGRLVVKNGVRVR